MLSNTLRCRMLLSAPFHSLCCLLCVHTKYEEKYCLFCCWFDLAGTEFRWSIDGKQSALALYCLGWVIYMFSRREVACVSCLLLLAETTVEVPYTRVLFLRFENGISWGLYVWHLPFHSLSMNFIISTFPCWLGVLTVSRFEASWRWLDLGQLRVNQVLSLLR